MYHVAVFIRCFNRLEQVQALPVCTEHEALRYAAECRQGEVRRVYRGISLVSEYKDGVQVV